MNTAKLVSITLLIGAAAFAARAHVEDGAIGNQVVPKLPNMRPAPELPVEHDEQSRNYFTDLPLVAQDGHNVRFYSDVLRDRVVLINFVYTDCKDACPLLTYKLKQVKEALGPRFGEEVFFVSISIDPENDSPEVLRKFAGDQQADVPGWLFLTGEKTNVDLVVKKLGQFRPRPETHSTVLLAGNVRTRHWTKISPSASVLEITLKLEGLAQEL